jgi:hypothetical protein
MSDHIIIVPTDARSSVRQGWISELLDTPLTAGEDVVFHDVDGNETNVNYFGFLADTTTERSIRFRGVGMLDAAAVPGTFSSGIFNPCPMCKIFADGTVANGNLRSRME